MGRVGTFQTYFVVEVGVCSLPTLASIWRASTEIYKSSAESEPFHAASLDDTVAFTSGTGNSHVAPVYRGEGRLRNNTWRRIYGLTCGLL